MRKPVFLEDWWLSAATDGAWEAVTIEQGGRTVGWLPYARDRHMGFSTCGLAPLTRLLYPLTDVGGVKGESADRERFKIESDLIDRLPVASCHRFILPPTGGNALAWQAKGFDARLEHTFIVDADLSDTVRWQQMRNKTRNVIRRAKEHLQPRTVDPAEFVREYRDNLGTSVDAKHLGNVHRLAEAAMARGQGRALAAIGPTGRPQAAVFFVWDDSDYYYFLSTRNTTDAALGAVAMLVWNGLLDAWTRRLRFDFDGVSSLGRLRFLQSFGGRLASRVWVERGSAAYLARLMLRRMRDRLRVGGHAARFS